MGTSEEHEGYLTLDLVVVCYLSGGVVNPVDATMVGGLISHDSRDIDVHNYQNGLTEIWSTGFVGVMPLEQWRLAISLKGYDPCTYLESECASSTTDRNRRPS